jgi:lipoprotein-releasing system ATP-binding protein
VIEVRGLSKSFGTSDGRVDVLRNIDLDIGRGERVGVVGSSGTGKTTLMHILGGLDRPTRGTVRFDGTDIFTLKGAALDGFRNRTVGFVFQFHHLLPEFTALENVMMPALVSRKSTREATPMAAGLLEEVGLSHRLKHKPGQLSGGEQQRVAIARALILSPRVLLADEPTGNLDSGTSAEIYRLLEQIHDSRELTMIIVTHSESLAARLDRVVHMVDGMVAS